jgi:hypothetical protein
VNFEISLGLKLRFPGRRKFEPINYLKNKNFFLAKGAQANPNGSLLSLYSKLLHLWEILFYFEPSYVWHGKNFTRMTILDW